ncbi:MAG: FecR domain-containing protein [Rhodospirillaceae bacterium]
MIFRRPPQTATAWVARLQAGPLSWWDRRALARWLAASPDHAKQLEAAQTVSELAQKLGGSARARQMLAQDLWARARAATGRRQGFALPSLAAAAVAAVIIVMAAPWNTPSLPRIDDGGSARTAVGQITDYALSDRSQITVAGASAVSIAFTEGRRDVALERGEAYFDVAPDRARPFVITAGAHKVTVTGTSFNVNYLAAVNEMEVAVVEGTVRVAYPSRMSTNDATAEMHAGDVILFTPEGPVLRRNLTPQQVSAWRSRKLYFDGANLSQVLAEVNRYSTKPVVTETQDIERLMLTGQFPAGDVESVLTSLQQLYGIEAQESTERWVLVRKQAKAAPRR